MSVEHISNGFRLADDVGQTMLDLQRRMEERRRRLLSMAGRIQPGTVTSSHALLLEIDLRLAYCAGAWVSAIVLACAAVEAQARQVATNAYLKPSIDLFDKNSELQWLRSVRNELVHAKEPGTPSQVWKLDGHEIGASQQALEPEATRAVEAMFKAIYGLTGR